MDARRERSFKAVIIVYAAIRLIVIGFLIYGIVNKDWDYVLYSVMTLAFLMLPSVIEKRLKIELPTALEIVVVLFIFSGYILGKLSQFYYYIPSWDLILHTITGFLMAAIGIALIDVLNKSPRINLSMSPIFVAFVAFCFSMTIGVCWEFTEYTLDNTIGSDGQKGTILSTMISEQLDETGRNKAVRVDDITRTVIYGTINGEEAELEISGYLDNGLVDTMEDLFVNLIGAVIFSVIGAVYIKSRGQGHVAEAFIPKLMSDEQAQERQKERRSYRRRWRRRIRKKSQLDDSAGNGSTVIDDNQGEGG